MIIIKMITPKRGREFNTSKPTEKKPVTNKFGVMLYDIPITITLEKLKGISNSENFIPKYKKKNMRVAFFICESEKKRKKVCKSASELDSSIKCTDFIPQWSLINNAISSLASISKNFNKIIKSNNSLIPTLKHQPDYYFNINKQLAISILENSYINIEQGFSYYLKNRGISARDEINIKSKNIEWVLIFYWCWFILYKVSSEQTLTRHSMFFYYFGENLKETFRAFSKCNYLIKYLVFDFLSQYFYFKNEFHNEVKICEWITSIIHINIIKKFTDEFNSIVENTKIIFNSKIIKHSSKKLLKISIDKNGINEFIENTYVISLPEGVQGYTLCNRTVMINLLTDSPISDKRDTIIGFTLMTMIHEFGHFASRFNLKSDYEWFEKTSPKIHGLKDCGSDFIKEIFGYEPETITPAASRFILNPNNWNVSHRLFEERFKDLNPYKAEYENTSKQRRLKQLANDNSAYRRLGGCKFSFRRQEKSDSRSKKI